MLSLQHVSDIDTDAPENTRADEDEKKSTNGKASVKVGLRFRIDQIESINTSAQTYNVISSLDMDWEATAEDLSNWKNNPKREYAPAFVPRIDPKNVVEKTVAYKPWANGNLYKIAEGDDGKFYNLRRIEYLIKWSEPFDVTSYPFDVQDLTFVFQSREFNKSQSRTFVPSRLFPTFFRMEKTYLAISDWRLVHCDAYVKVIDWSALRKTTGVAITVDTKAAKGEKKGRRVVPRMIFRVQFQRLAFPVLTRVHLWLFLLGLLAYCVFGIPPGNLADRLSYTITMDLAFVAFQYVISDQIPRVPYLTLVDKYNISMFLAVLVLSMESVIVGWHSLQADYEDELKEFDKWFAVGYAVLFVLAHFWFAYICYTAQEMERMKIGKTKEQINKIAHRAEEVEIASFNRQEFYTLHKERTDATS